MKTYDFHSNVIAQYVSAPCAAGKTYAACQYIANEQGLTNHIYVAPSLRLLKQTSETLQANGVKPTVITSETQPGHVKRAIIDKLKEKSAPGKVLLITWQAYVDLPDFLRRPDWQVIVDEVPQLDQWHTFKLPRNLAFITDHVQVVEHSEISKIGRVRIRNKDAIERLYETARDDVNEMFRSFFSDLLSPKKQMFVDMDSWTRLAGERQVSKEDESNQLFFLSMLRPSAVEDTILLGANIKDSLLVRWLEKEGYRLEEHKAIAAKLRSVPNNLGSRLKVSYFIPDRHFSKKLANKADEKAIRLIDTMDQAALAAFGSEPFLYVANNDRKSEILDNAEQAKRISVLCHGLNAYDKFNNIYFSAALNREPKHFAMLKELGLDPDVVHQANAHEVNYQAVMRTSLRDPGSTAKVHAIVADEPSAKRVAALVGTNDVSQLGAFHERPRSPWSAAEKAKRQSANKAFRDLYAPNPTPMSYINDSGMDFGAFDSTGTYTGHNLPHCFVVFHQSPYDDEGQKHLMKNLSVNEFAALLKIMAKAPCDSKEELPLFNPCVFDPPEGAQGFRRQEYFKMSSFLALDFDNGNLSKDDFIDIFWTKAKRGQKRSFVICNSFSRSPDNPNRFRVIMFYKRPAMTPAQHGVVYDAVVARLEENGFTAASAKLDKQCRSGVQSFYIPATNREHPEWAFFEKYGLKSRELRRCAIDPVLVEKAQKASAPRPTWEPPIDTDSNFASEVSRERIDEALRELRTLKEGRHKPLFDAAVALAKMGLQKMQIEQELIFAVGRETKMRKKIREALRSLERYGWFSGRRRFAEEMKTAWARGTQANTSPS